MAYDVIKRKLNQDYTFIYKMDYKIGHVLSISTIFFQKDKILKLKCLDNLLFYVKACKLALYQSTKLYQWVHWV